MENRASSQFAALIRLDAPAIFVSVLLKKFVDDVNGGGFRGREKHPNIARGFINDQKVRRETVIREHYPIFSLVPAGVSDVEARMKPKSM